MSYFMTKATHMYAERNPGVHRRQHYSDRHFAEIADRWGYECAVAVGGRAGEGGAHRPTFTGLIEELWLPGGLRLCASDITALEGNERNAVLGRMLVIVYLIAGNPVTYRFDGIRRLRLRPGEAAVIAASDALPAMTAAARGERSRLLVLQADAAQLVDAELAGEVERQLSATMVRPLPTRARTLDLADELFHGQWDRLADRLLAESCALELLSSALSPRGEQPNRPLTATPGDHARILRLCDFLKCTLDRDHSLAGLAREAGMSVSSLKAKFGLVTGQSVFRFLAEQRLERARRGLEEEGWSVAQAAYFVGYRHATNFATAFRRKFGISPGSARSS